MTSTLPFRAAWFRAMRTALNPSKRGPSLSVGLVSHRASHVRSAREATHIEQIPYTPLSFLRVYRVVIDNPCTCYSGVAA